MQILENNWLTSDPIDFEYKKYMLLAYEQHHMKLYGANKLYPNFTDVIDKLTIVNEFLQKMKQMEDSKLSIKTIDFVNEKLVYVSDINDPSLKEVKEIALFSKKVLVNLYQDYRNLMDDVDESISISGSRVEIFNLYDGYIILRGDGKERIYEYEVYRKILPHPHYVLKTRKANLKDYFTNRFCKNVFDVIFKEHYPLKESIIPLYRRKFLECLFGFR